MSTDAVRAIVLALLLSAPAASRAAAQECIRASPPADPDVTAAYRAARELDARGDRGPAPIDTAAIDTAAVDEAAARFRAIALDHPEHEVAPYAASLWLDAMNRLASADPARRDACLDAMSAAIDPIAARFCPAQAELCETLDRLRCEVARLTSERLARDRPADAAAALVAIVDAHPACPRSDEMLWNASVLARAAGDPERAIALAERLASSAPASPLAAGALAQAARGHRDLARYEDAARDDERLAAIAPAARCDDLGCPDAPRALTEAAELRIALGELEGALRDAREHQRLFARARPTDDLRLRLLVALALERGGLARDSARLLEAGPDATVPVDLAIVIHATRARLDARHAARERAAARALWAAHGARLAQDAGSDDAWLALARASDAIAELTFGATDELARSLDSARPRGDPARWLEARRADLERLEHALAPIEELGSPRWIVAALDRLASSHRALADALPEAGALLDRARELDRRCAELVVRTRTPTDAGLRCLERALPARHELTAPPAFDPDALAPPRLPE